MSTYFCAKAIHQNKLFSDLASSSIMLASYPGRPGYEASIILLLVLCIIIILEMLRKEVMMIL